MRFRLRLGCVLAAMALGPAAVGAEPALTRVTRVTRVAVVELEPVEYSVTLPEKVGLLEAAASLVLSFQVPGRVERILGQGARVAEGGEIAALDADLEEAELRRAELLLREAQQELRRVRGLAAQKAASAQQLDSAEIQYGMRIAERDAAHERLERRTLRARFDGVVAEVDIEPGEVASPGVPVAHLLNFDLMRLEVGVPGHQIGRVKPGARAWAAIPALGGRRFEGLVHEVAPSATTGGALFEVDILVPNHSGPLKPGMTARAVIETRTVADALVVPLEASVERGGRRVVFFVADGHAHAVPVDGQTLHGDRIVIEGGLPHRSLVVRGQHDLEDGWPVEIDNSIIAGLPGPDGFGVEAGVAGRADP
jgi:membrane fusion protein (multidrug efflux system)